MGSLGLCLRLKRLGEQITQDARRLYRELNLDIEPGWNSILLMLEQEPQGLGVSQIARNLGISHPSASVTVRQLVTRGYVDLASDPSDGRRRVVQLSDKAVAELPEFKRIWDAFERSMQDVINAAGDNVFEVIAGLESELRNRSMDERTMDQIDLVVQHHGPAEARPALTEDSTG